MGKDIKTKLNLHLKKRIKQTNTQKRKSDVADEDPDTQGPSKRASGKQRTIKPKPVEEEELSDKGDGDPAPVQKGVSTLDVLQLLLNEKKRSLMMDEEVINFIRTKQGKIP